MVQATRDVAVADLGWGSGSSIEPPFLGNSKFLQFILPPPQILCIILNQFINLKLSEVVINIFVYIY